MSDLDDLNDSSRKEPALSSPLERMMMAPTLTKTVASPKKVGRLSTFMLDRRIANHLGRSPQTVTQSNSLDIVHQDNDFDGSWAAFSAAFSESFRGVDQENDGYKNLLGGDSTDDDDDDDNNSVGSCLSMNSSNQLAKPQTIKRTNTRSSVNLISPTEPATSTQSECSVNPYDIPSLSNPRSHVNQNLMQTCIGIRMMQGADSNTNTNNNDESCWSAVEDLKNATWDNTQRTTQTSKKLDDHSTTKISLRRCSSSDPNITSLMTSPRAADKKKITRSPSPNKKLIPRCSSSDPNLVLMTTSRAADKKKIIRSPSPNKKLIQRCSSSDPNLLLMTTSRAADKKIIRSPSPNKKLIQRCPSSDPNLLMTSRNHNNSKTNADRISKRSERTLSRRRERTIAGGDKTTATATTTTTIDDCSSKRIERTRSRRRERTTAGGDKTTATTTITLDDCNSKRIERTRTRRRERTTAGGDKTMATTTTAATTSPRSSPKPQLRKSLTNPEVLGMAPFSRSSTYGGGAVAPYSPKERRTNKALYEAYPSAMEISFHGGEDEDEDTKGDNNHDKYPSAMEISFDGGEDEDEDTKGDNSLDKYPSAMEISFGGEDEDTKGDNNLDCSANSNSPTRRQKRGERAGRGRGGGGGGGNSSPKPRRGGRQGNQESKVRRTLSNPEMLQRALRGGPNSQPSKECRVNDDNSMTAPFHRCSTHDGCAETKTRDISGEGSSKGDPTTHDHPSLDQSANGLLVRRQRRRRDGGGSKQRRGFEKPPTLCRSTSDPESLLRSVQDGAANSGKPGTISRNTGPNKPKKPLARCRSTQKPSKLSRSTSNPESLLRAVREGAANKPGTAVRTNAGPDKPKKPLARCRSTQRGQHDIARRQQETTLTMVKQAEIDRTYMEHEENIDDKEDNVDNSHRTTGSESSTQSMTMMETMGGWLTKTRRESTASLSSSVSSMFTPGKMKFDLGFSTLSGPSTSTPMKFDLGFSTLSGPSTSSPMKFDLGFSTLSGPSTSSPMRTKMFDLSAYGMGYGEAEHSSEEMDVYEKEVQKKLDFAKQRREENKKKEEEENATTAPAGGIPKSTSAPSLVDLGGERQEKRVRARERRKKQQKGGEENRGRSYTPPPTLSRTRTKERREILGETNKSRSLSPHPLSSKHTMNSIKEEPTSNKTNKHHSPPRSQVSKRHQHHHNNKGTTTTTPPSSLKDDDIVVKEAAGHLDKLHMRWDSAVELNPAIVSAGAGNDNNNNTAAAAVRFPKAG